jgi:hypothetical protein
VEIYQKKLAENKQDSFWYEGAIASFHEKTLYATGDITVVTKEGEVLGVSDALEYAEEHNLTDDNLYTELQFTMNNWFEIISDDGGDGIVYDSYDEAMRGLTEQEV